MLKDSNYFSWRNISEMADIDSHIVFATTLMGKYDWEEAGAPDKPCGGLCRC